jgi:hypothetical protein
MMQHTNKFILKMDAFIGNQRYLLFLFVMKQKETKNSRRIECFPARKTIPQAPLPTSSSHLTHNAAPAMRHAYARLLRNL